MTEELIDAVLAQIVKDVKNEDLTAIQELLLSCPKAALEAFLPEVTIDE